MFDEVDEGTAIYKVANVTPVGKYFVTYEGLPSDYYLKLTGAATRMIRPATRRCRRRFPIRCPVRGNDGCCAIRVRPNNPALLYSRRRKPPVVWSARFSPNSITPGSCVKTTFLLIGFVL